MVIGHVSANACGRSSFRRYDELVDQPGNLIGLVLPARKSPSVSDSHMLLPLGPWNALVKENLASFRNRVPNR